MNSRPLTLATLRRKGACKDQLARFRALFGASVEVTEELAREHAGVFDFDWAAVSLLSAVARAAYEAARAEAWAAYSAARAEAGAAYYAATAEAWVSYKAATAPARASYEAAWAEAWASYKAATDEAVAAYYAATATAWARAYIQDGGGTEP